MKSLLVVSSAPATLVDGKPFLDIKFAEGMRRYSYLWDGPVRCLLKKGATTFQFGKTYDPNSLPFEVEFFPEGTRINAQQIFGHDVILCSGDNHEYLHLAQTVKGIDGKIVFIIEYIPETRRQIVFLDKGRSLPKKLYSVFWNMNQERRRRHAFRLADGIQANGYPAHAAYSPLNSNTMMYLDNRVGNSMFATPAEMDARAQRLASGAPLRLVHSGRLEPMKGSQDLIPIAKRLASQGLDFQLDIFGHGSLEEEIKMGIARHGLQDRITLHGIVDFETELVPFARQNSDIFLSCHRQSDPSCSYLENMGCGLAVAGYANRMWSALCQQSAAGWAVPLGNADALADAVVEVAQDRAGLIETCRTARTFAAQHSFEEEFGKRIQNLREVADL